MYFEIKVTVKVNFGISHNCCIKWQVIYIIKSVDVISND